MRVFKRTLLPVVLIALWTVSLPASAEYRDMPMTSAMLGYTSNFIYRGETYSADQPAVQAAYQYSGPFYWGVWGSQIHDGTQSGTNTDIYVGIKRMLNGPFGIDLGGVTHQYWGTSYQDISEYYAGLIFGPVRIAYYNEINNTSDYIDFHYKVGNRLGALLLLHWGRDTAGDDIKLTLGKEISDIRFGVGGVYETRGTASTTVFLSMELYIR